MLARGDGAGRGVARPRAPGDFCTYDRYADLQGGLEHPGRGMEDPRRSALLTQASAVWLLPGGPFRYATLAASGIAVNP